MNVIYLVRWMIGDYLLIYSNETEVNDRNEDAVDHI